MNLREFERKDRVTTENWKGEMTEILVLVSVVTSSFPLSPNSKVNAKKASLFSATVSAFIIERSKLLVPDSSDATVAWLVQVSQQLVNISDEMPVQSVTAPSNLSCKPIASAILSDTLWFLSLALSLICALSATLMQQWEPHRPEFAQGRDAARRRARMSACIHDGDKRFRTPRRVKTISTLLRISVLLFFAGLVEPLLPMNRATSLAPL
jgi:Family of unknown function (DUF6535)